MAYERYLLVLDDEGERLGDVSVRLVRLGVDALYTKDPDEAFLVASEQARRIGAILVPAATPIETLRERIAAVGARAGIGARSVAAVGPPPDEEGRAALRELGLRWALWEPFDDAALRFVSTTALAEEHDTDGRMELRVPTAIKATVYKGTQRKDVRVHNLSVGGAYLATGAPWQEGTQVSLEIDLPDVPLAGRATVAHTHDDDSAPPHLAAGMGVCFNNLDLDGQATLRQLVQSVLARFEL